MFWLPEGIGEVEVGHVEHEEVVQIAHNADQLKGVKKADLQVRPRRRVHAGHGRLPLDQHRQGREDQGRRRHGRAARRHRRRRAGPQRGRQEVRRPDRRRHLRHRQEGRQGTQGVPVSGRRQPGAASRRYGIQVVVAPDRVHAGHHARAPRHGQPRQQAGRPQERRAQPRGVQRRRLRGPDAGLRVPRRLPRDGVGVQARTRTHRRCSTWRSKTHQKPLVGGRPSRERRPAARVPGPILGQTSRLMAPATTRTCLVLPGGPYSKDFRAGRGGPVPRTRGGRPSERRPCGRRGDE